MRVAGGEARGRRLKGTVSLDARPTTERVRAAIFNILPPEVYQEGRVLDLYAGSGSLGIEALSWGAAWADFVERSRPQCAVIQANLEVTGFSQKARVYWADAVQSLPSLPGSYQLVLMDPPYRLQELGTVLERLVSVGRTDGRPPLVVDGGMVVVGHSKHLTLLPYYGPLASPPDSLSIGDGEGVAKSEVRLGPGLYLASHRRYGDNVVDFFQWDNGPVSPSGRAE